MYRVCYSIAPIHHSMPDWLLVELNAAAVVGLALIDAVILEHYPAVPKLYELRPRFYIEKVERWKDIDTVIRDGNGDCKDFVAWRLAELWRDGVSATAESVVSRDGASLQFHTYVRYGDGAIEDPARLLGMP